MKLVTNKVPVITNGTWPMMVVEKGTSVWTGVEIAEAGTVFKVKAIMMDQVFLENSKCSIPVNVNLFKEFFTEHQVEV